MLLNFQLQFGDTSSILGVDSFAPSPCRFCESKNTVIPKEHAISIHVNGKMMILLWNVYPILTQFQLPSPPLLFHPAPCAFPLLSLVSIRNGGTTDTIFIYYYQTNDKMLIVEYLANIIWWESAHNALVKHVKNNQKHVKGAANPGWSSLAVISMRCCFTKLLKLLVRGTSLGFAHLWWWQSWSKASSGSYASPHPQISGLFRSPKNSNAARIRASEPNKTQDPSKFILASWYVSPRASDWLIGAQKCRGAASSMSSSNICLARSRTPPLGPRASSTSRLFDPLTQKKERKNWQKWIYKTQNHGKIW